VVIITIVGPIVIYVVNILLSWVLYALIYLVISLFATEDAYVHWSFLSYCLHAVVHLTGFALAVFLGLLALIRPVIAPVLPNGQQSVAPSPAGKTRVRFAVRSMAKAFLVAIATGIGSQLGGWLGGVLVFVLASGASALLGIVESAPEAK
jgi:hypothetical protein